MRTHKALLLGMAPTFGRLSEARNLNARDNLLVWANPQNIKEPRHAYPAERTQVETKPLAGEA